LLTGGSERELVGHAGSRCLEINKIVRVLQKVTTDGGMYNLNQEIEETNHGEYS
jgi:hypothetical protein